MVCFRKQPNPLFLRGHGAKKFSISSSFYSTLLLLFFFFGNVSSYAQVHDLIAAPPQQSSLFPADSALWLQDIPASKPKHPYLLRNAAYVAAGATAWVTAYAWVDEPLQQFSQSHRSRVVNTVADLMQPLGRQRNLAPVAGAALLGGLMLKDQKLQKVGTLTLGSIVVNALATSALKSSFGRHRPSNTSENHIFDAPFSNKRNTSLPSSHTSTAFAVATSVATVYKDHKFVPPLAYGVATLVGLSRINDNMHWASDVLAGAAVGYLSAKVANRLYDAASQRIMTRRQKLYFTPQVGSSSATMNMTLVF